MPNIFIENTWLWSDIIISNLNTKIQPWFNLESNHTYIWNNMIIYLWGPLCMMLVFLRVVYHFLIYKLFILKTYESLSLCLWNTCLLCFPDKRFYHERFTIGCLYISHPFISTIPGNKEQRILLKLIQVRWAKDDLGV